MQPFGHNKRGPEIEGGCCSPFGEAESPSDTMWPGPRPTSVPSGILILDPSNRLVTIQSPTSQTGQTGQDNSPIACGEPFYKRSPKNGPLAAVSQRAAEYFTKECSDVFRCGAECNVM